MASIHCIRLFIYLFIYRITFYISVVYIRFPAVRVRYINLKFYFVYQCYPLILIPLLEFYFMDLECDVYPSILHTK